MAYPYLPPFFLHPTTIKFPYNPIFLILGQFSLICIELAQSIDKSHFMVNNIYIGKSPKGGQTSRAFLTPYLVDLSTMIISKISHSAFSVR